jgi:hypothetical protein
VSREIDFSKKKLTKDDIAYLVERGREDDVVKHFREHGKEDMTRQDVWAMVTEPVAAPPSDAPDDAPPAESEPEPAAEEGAKE